MIEGKRADSARRRERVLQALDAALRSGQNITVSGLARTARVDRTFLYRHRDLLERAHAAATTPAEAGRTAAVSRASLQTDLANALERNTRRPKGQRDDPEALSAGPSPYLRGTPALFCQRQNTGRTGLDDHYSAVV